MRHLVNTIFTSVGDLATESNTFFKPRKHPICHNKFHFKTNSHFSDKN